MSRAFDRLRRAVTRKYLHKGYSRARARYIGRATAGKVAASKRRKRKRLLHRLAGK